MVSWFKKKPVPAANYVARFTVPPGKSTGYYNQALSQVGQRPDLSDADHRALVEATYNALCAAANHPLNRSYQLPYHPDACVETTRHHELYNQAIKTVGPRPDLTDKQLQDAIFAEYDNLFSIDVWASIHATQAQLDAADMRDTTEERRHQELLQAIHDSSTTNQVLGLARRHPMLTGGLLSVLFNR